MHSHLLALLLFAALTSTALAALARDEPREGVRLAVRLFLGLVLGALLCGWLMSPLPN